MPSTSLFRLPLTVLVLSALAAGPGHGGTAEIQQPNIILIMGDDQRWDTLFGEHGLAFSGVLPQLERLLVREGVLFTEAVVSSPLCCPARSSLLSGGYYSHHTGVLTNNWPAGGARRFQDARNLGSLLQLQGYTTAIIGKYMNNYGQVSGKTKGGEKILEGRYIPPGWDAFVVFTVDSPDWREYPFTVGTSSAAGPTSGSQVPEDKTEFPFFLQELVEQGFPASTAAVLAGTDLEDLPHIASFERDLALSIIEHAAGQPEEPFFLYLSTVVPHSPATPMAQDQDMFPGFQYRGRGWGEPDLEDKPPHIQDNGENFDDLYDDPGVLCPDGRLPDEFFGDQLRSLQALDRTVGDLVRRLEAEPELAARTVIVFTSDHGLQWGEHRVVGMKKMPYEESIRVPLVVRYPGSHGRISHEQVTADVDLGATILHLGGYSEEELAQDLRCDGRSIVPILLDPGRKGTSQVLIQDYRSGGLRAFPSWAGIRSKTWKYVQYDTLEEELFQLRKDPYELESLHTAQAPWREKTVRRLEEQLQDKRGLVILSRDWVNRRLPRGHLGEAYSFQFTATGGLPPYTWFNNSGRELSFVPGAGCRPVLPPGLELTAAGLLHGVPLLDGCFEITLAVRDSSVSPQHGGSQLHLRRARLVINH